MLKRAYDGLHAALGVIAAVLIAAVAVGTSADVVMRNAGWGVIPGALELSEYALFVATFLGAPWVLKENGHIRVDIVLSGLPRRAARVVEIAGDVLGFLVSAVVLAYAIRLVLLTHSEGRRVIKEFIFPEWWIYALVSVALLLLTVEFLRRLRNALAAPASDPAG